jgi:hypothetical protein
MRTRPFSARVLTIRLTEADLRGLEDYCRAHRLSKTAAILNWL